MYLGVDVGSSSSKALVLDSDKRVIGQEIINLGTGSRGPEQAVVAALEKAGIRETDIKKCVVTGYGRMIYPGADKQLTEISCHAKGINYLFQDVRTLIDVGGQDAKVIRIGADGSVDNFFMNDKCAAGTGRFLEMMARVLNCSIAELSSLAEKGVPGTAISSTCTVFAESEVISQLALGKSLEDVALGAHKSIAQKITGLVNRMGIAPGLAMSGGVALNDNLVECLQAELGYPIERSSNPQIIGALGAALYAWGLENAAAAQAAAQ